MAELTNTSGSDCSYDSINVDDTQKQVSPTPLLLGILPSYQMYQAIIAKSMDLSPDNLESLPAYTAGSPPNATVVGTHLDFDEIRRSMDTNSTPVTAMESDYQTFSCATSTLTSEAAMAALSIEPIPGTIPRNQSVSNSLEPQFTQTSTQSASESILSSHSSLRDTDSSAIEMEVFFTSEAGQPGIPPKLIDISSHSFTNGDYLHGYVLINNTSTVVTLFSRFYVILEGNVIVSKALFPSKINGPRSVRNFLQAVDISASFNYFSIDQNQEIDPLDGSQLCFNEDRLIHTGTLYKRFFSFRIPDKLLDSFCKDESMITHKQLPPSMEAQSNSHINLSFINTTIEYSINAKIVSRDPQANEYVTLKGVSRNLNMLPKGISLSPEEELLHISDRRFLQDNFTKRVNHLIHLGKQLRNIIPEDPLDVSKNRYIPSELLHVAPSFGTSAVQSSIDSFQDPTTIHRSFLPIHKKFFSSNKVVGNLLISISTKEHKVTYIPPLPYRKLEISQTTLDTWKIKVPISLEYNSTSLNNGSISFPEIKSISASFVTFSIMSDKHKIPFEFGFEHIFNNNTGEDFKDLYISKYKNLNQELFNQVQNIPKEQFPIDLDIASDLTSILNLRTKKAILDILDVTINKSTNHKTNHLTWNQNVDNSFKKSIEVNVDITKAFTKDFEVSIDLKNAQARKSFSNLDAPTYDTYCMVPSYQNCIISRLYYIELQLLVLNGKTVTTKIPVSIVNK